MVFSSSVNTANIRLTKKGQRLYPRYEHFKQMIEVFERSGRGVPTFNDKHLSWNWEWAREMYDISQSMDFAFMAGSSLPVTWRTPSIDLPLGVAVSEAVCVGYGGVDSYDFHALETLQVYGRTARRRRKRREMAAGIPRRRVLGSTSHRTLVA